jgi:hypothetical protein
VSIVPDTKDWIWVLDRACPECGFDASAVDRTTLGIRTRVTRFDAVPDGAWGRPGRRSNGSTFTVESLGRYFLHDIEHHLHDVRPRQDLPRTWDASGNRSFRPLAPGHWMGQSEITRASRRCS